MKTAPYRATKPLRWGMPDGRVVNIDTGELVPDDGNTNYDRMVRIGLLERAPVAEATGVSAPTSPDVPDDLDDLSKSDLWELASDMGLSEDEVEGTGANGNILKTDLIRALEEAR